MDDKTIIKNIVTGLNKAVAEGKLDKIGPLFHENIKIVSPELKIHGDNKEICIQSYIDFLSKAKIEQYTDNITDIFVYENTAVVFYTYNITWSMGGKSFTDQGKELYVLTKENNKWLIILRKLIGSAH